MICDANMYWLPEELFTDNTMQKEFLSCIPEQYGWYRHIEELTDGTKEFILEKPKGFPSLNYRSGEYSLAYQLSAMRQAGVDKGILKLPGCQEFLSLDLCREFNDRMAEHVKESGGKLTALAVVPPYAERENMKELERCHEELHMNTVQLSAHYGKSYLDEEKFAPFFACLNDLHMNAYVHHTPVPVEYGKFADYDNVRRFYGRIVDQGLAVSRELWSGFFDRYPNLHFAHSMMGGAFYAIRDMLLPKGGGDSGRFASDKGHMAEVLKDHIWFEMSHAQPWGKDGLSFAIRTFGADRVIYGSSFPVKKNWQQDGPKFVENLGLSNENLEAVLFGNAEQFYQLKGEA